MDVMNSTDAMNNQDTSESEQSSVGGSHKSLDDRRKPTCKLCANHNLKILSNSHKRYCLGQHCLCGKCFKKRAEHRQTADKTKDTRANKQDKERRELMEQKKLPKQERVDPSKPVIPFIIAHEERDLDICKSNEDLIVFEKYIRKEVIINKMKKQEVKKRKGKKQKINEEEIVESKGNNLDLLHFMLDKWISLVYNVDDMYRSLVYNVYDMRHTSTTQGWTLPNSDTTNATNTIRIRALVNEIVIAINDYVYHSSNSNEDAENSIHLLEAKKRILLHICEIHRLKVDEIHKLTDVIQRVMTQDFLRNPPLYHYFSNTLESTYMYRNVGIDMPPSPYNLLTLNHLAGSATVPPYTNISPKPSTEPSSTYYRSIADGQ